MHLPTVVHSLYSHWKGKVTAEELLAVSAKVDCDAWKLQRDAGIELVALDGTLYDQACALHLSISSRIIAVLQSLSARFQVHVLIIAPRIITRGFE